MIFHWPPAMTCKIKRKKKEWKHFVSLCSCRRTRELCDAVATFLCCIPATNTDDTRPGLGFTYVVYLGNNLGKLSFRNMPGHPGLYWELHFMSFSLCLECQILLLVSFLGLRFMIKKHLFFASYKSLWQSFPNFLFVTKIIDSYQRDTGELQLLMFWLHISHACSSQPSILLICISTTFRIMGREEEEDK